MTSRTATVLLKDLRLGPRSPLVWFAVLLPVLLTLLIRGVFGALFLPDPRLGVVDHGDSVLVAQAQAVEGLDVTLFDDEAELRRWVEADDLDAGLVLAEGFDVAVRAGQRPRLELFVGGESVASHRILVAVTTLDLVRGLTTTAPPLEVDLVPIGDRPLPLELQLLPLVVIMAVAIAGATVPAASLVEEKERRTLDALLVSPLRMSEVLLAKGLLGWGLAVVSAVVTLSVNGVLARAPVVMLLAVAIGAVMMAEVGLLLGAWAPDTNTMFAAWKGGAVLLLFPVIFFVWPGIPTWPARLGPTYYFLQPIFAASVEGATLADVWPQLLVGAGICAALVPVVRATGDRLQRRVVAGADATAKP